MRALLDHEERIIERIDMLDKLAADLVGQVAAHGAELDANAQTRIEQADDITRLQKLVDQLRKGFWPLIKAERERRRPPDSGG